jgi:flavin-dependent dehydrogenase
LLVAERRAAIGRVIRRKQFDAALAEQAKQRGVRLLEGHGVNTLERRSDGVSVTLDDGRELRAKAVVGADGVGSVIRRAIGVRRKSFYAQAIEVDTPRVADDPDPEHLHFDAHDRSLRGYLWDFPTIVDDQPLVCRGVYELRGTAYADSPDADEAPRGPSVKQRLIEHLERRGLDPTGLRFKQFSERAMCLHEPIAVPRAMLVGEAAGIDPLLGEGIAQAVLYGEVAGPYLARCVRRSDYGFDDWWRVFSMSRVGLDLHARARMAAWVYDDTRPLAERFITFSQGFADAGIHYFAGDPVPRLALAKAAWQLARAGVQGHPYKF